MFCVIAKLSNAPLAAQWWFFALGHCPEETSFKNLDEDQENEDWRMAFDDIDHCVEMMKSVYFHRLIHIKDII